MSYAQVHLEDRDADDNVYRYAPGDEVPETINGYDELVENGSIVEEFDPNHEALQPAGPPDHVEIDGVRYERTAQEAADDQE